MQLRMPRRGALVSAFWLALVLFALAFVLYRLFLPWGVLWLAAAGASALGLLYFMLRAAGARVTLSGGELLCRRGLVMHSTRRMPLARLAGVSVFASPLQRLLGLCCAVLHFSGGTVLLFGLPRSDGDFLLALPEGGAAP